jgi:ligand-binding SRPBCC domain-containing protein
MPTFETQITLARPVADVFDFLCHPVNLIGVTPPEFNLTVVEAPDPLHLGARMVLQGRRWGFAQRVVSEITAFEPNLLMTDEQREGPFKKWTITHRLEAIPEGTRMTIHIDFEPPGGLLGLLVTADRTRAELKELYAYREKRLRELLERK